MRSDDPPSSAPSPIQTTMCKDGRSPLAPMSHLTYSDRDCGGLQQEDSTHADGCDRHVPEATERLRRPGLGRQA